MSMWIAGITRGHNGSVCLLKDDEVIFAIEEERLSRQKYDGGPYAAMVKILEYTKKLDYLVIAHTQPLHETAGRVDFSGDDVYTGLARKLGLISRKEKNFSHPQVIDLSFFHHKLHAACAFYRSGFKEAVALVVDGSGTFTPMFIENKQEMLWEVESIIKCGYPHNFQTLYKHMCGNGPWCGGSLSNMSNEKFKEEGTHELIVDDTAGIVKAYEAVTHYCGWPYIEAGKTMGLFPYGKPNKNIPEIFTDAGNSKWISTNRHLIIPTFPNGSKVNEARYSELESTENMPADVTTLQNRRDMAYAIQTQSQAEVLRLIEKAVSMSGIKNVVISGGYGLNCVANYFYLKNLKDKDINLYVEPISNDAGTAIGAAMLVYHEQTKNNDPLSYAESLYLGPSQQYTLTDIQDKVKEYGGILREVNYKEIVGLLRKKNIVTIFQGRSENGPRALGNRSILFDPTFSDGKDFVNLVKRREYFRPFAGTVLAEHANKWFDMCGLKQSPHMMYAVDCLPGIQEKIPSIIHIDGTCRIQTVTKEQNYHFYNLIEEFYRQTDIPILFNTSFNLGGDPLVETLEDALSTLARSDIQYLYLPEHSILVTIPNKKNKINKLKKI